MILRRRIMVLDGGSTGEDYVDLGLPSDILWAVGNLVKDSQGNYSIGTETDLGTYISWGNIDGHNESELYNFNSTTYNSTPGRQVVSNILSSDSAHDICLARLGAPWYLPTKEDFEELYNNTDGEWTTINGVNGWKFMKKTDHSVFVFFPAAGNYNGTSFFGYNSNGYYWLSSYSNSSSAYSFDFSSSGVSPGHNVARYLGYLVRAVLKPMFSITITLTGDSVSGITVTVTDSNRISHTGTTDSNGVVQLTGVISGSAKIRVSGYGLSNNSITVNASSRSFTCELWLSASQYLTFKSVTNCTHKFTKAVSYSIDGGVRWRNLAANTMLSVPAGNSVMWKAKLTPSSSGGIGTFSVTADTMKFEVEGNPMSLLYGDDFIGQTDLTGKNYAFLKLFNNNKGVVDAYNLSLPATTLANGCCNSMFEGCTELTTAPELPATTLANNCYLRMFYNCSALNYIKCMATNISATNCLQNWVYNVVAGGIFVKASGMTSWSSGVNGIPSGWTVQDA